MIDVSIIIPIYNREGTLGYCFDSINNIKYKKFEIILIDDGSTDGSATLCKEFCKTHIEAQYYYKKNRGVSSARNLGIEKAKGRWITFVDSDDAVRPEHLDIVSWEANNDKDWLIESFSPIHENDINKSDIELRPLSDLRKESSVPAIYYFKELVQTDTQLFSVCGKFFKRELCRQNYISFREDINFGEDQIFILDYLRYIKNMVHYPKMYTYVQVDRLIIGKGQRLTSRVLPLKEYYNVIYQNYEAFRTLDSLAENYNIPYGVNNLVYGMITFALINYCRRRHTYLLKTGELISFMRNSVKPLFASVFPYKRYIKEQQKYYIYVIYYLIVSNHCRMALAFCHSRYWYKALESYIGRYINKCNINRK